MSEGRGIEGTVQRCSKRTGRGTIQLVDRRVVTFTARVVERSGIRDLLPGDAVTVVLKETRGQASAAEIQLRDPRHSARQVRRQIEVAEEEMREELDRPITILLVGRTGVGKSSTINTLLGVEWASVGDHEPETATIHSYEGKIGEADVRVIDTPGFCDDRPGKGKDNRYLRQMVEVVDEVDLMLFVTILDDTRVRADEIHALELLTKSFGEEIWEKAVVVFTRADRLRQSEYEAGRDGRLAAFRRWLRQVAPAAGSVPFVPVSNERPRTPDRRLWLPALWIACLERMTDAGFEPFFLSTASRLESTAPRRRGQEAAVTKPATKAAQRERTRAVHPKPGGDSPRGSRPTTGRSSGAPSAKTGGSPRAKSEGPRAGKQAGAASPPPSGRSTAARSGRTAPPATVAAAPVARSPRPLALVKAPPVPAEIVEPGKPGPATVDSVTERRQGGVPIVEKKFSSTQGHGAIVVSNSSRVVIQQLVERRAPRLLQTILKVGAGLLPKIRQILGF